MEIAFVLAAVSSGVAIIAFGSAVMIYRRLRHFEQRYRRFFSGKNAADLEAVIVAAEETRRKMRSDLKLLAEANRVLAELQQESVQHVGLVRFNSFADTGGNNSFALCLLDAQGNGVVISSLYGRESMRIYSKPVAAGESAIPLTAEEKRAILESRYPGSNARGEQ